MLAALNGLSHLCKKSGYFAKAFYALKQTQNRQKDKKKPQNALFCDKIKALQQILTYCNYFTSYFFNSQHILKLSSRIAELYSRLGSQLYSRKLYSRKLYCRNYNFPNHEMASAFQ